MDREELFLKMKNNKKIIYLLIVIVIILAGLYVLTRSKKNSDIVLYGNVDIRQVSLSFNASDRIDKIYVEEGDTIINGQLLATLNTENLLLQIEKIKAEIKAQESIVLRLRNGSRAEEISQMLAKVNVAKAEAQNASMQLKRIESAYNSSGGRSVSKQERDDARSKVKITSAQVKEASESHRLAVLGPRKEEIEEAEAQLKVAHASLAIQEYLLSQAQLKAPVDGVIRSRLQEPGDMASPQRATFLIALNDKKWIRAYVQENQLGLVNLGMEVDIYIDSHSDRIIKGQVGYISSVAEFTPKTVQTEELRTSLLYEVRVYVNDNDNILRMGMPATVKINKSISKLDITNNQKE